MGPWKEIRSCPESEIGCRMELDSSGKLKLFAKVGNLTEEASVFA